MKSFTMINHSIIYGYAFTTDNLTLNKSNLFVPQKGQPECPPIRATCLSPNKSNLLSPKRAT